MKICITSVTDSTKSEMDFRFGRCSYLAIYNDESSEFEFIKNENAIANNGAGVGSAQSIIDHGVEVLITGNIGPNALKLLNASQIEVYEGLGDTLNEIIEKFKAEELSLIEKPVKAHFGLANRHGREGA